MKDSRIKLGKYVVEVERDPESGWWLGSVVETVPELQGLATNGKTLPTLRKRVRDLLSLEAKDAFTAEIEYRITWKRASVGKHLEEAQSARLMLSEVQTKAKTATKRVVRELSALGVSRTDAADLLGLSPQRIQQLTG